MTKSLKRLAACMMICLAVSISNSVMAQYYPVNNLQGNLNGATAILTWEQPTALFLSEGFEAGIPSTWQNVDADGDGNLWMQGSLGAPHSGTGFAASESYKMGNLTPDNWLISPQVTLEGNPVLVFYVAPSNSQWNAEHYGVYISTTGTELSDFTLIYEETISNGSYEEHTIDLSSYSGAVYVAWRHFNCSGQDCLTLDDISIDSQQPASGITGYNVYRDYELVASLGADMLTYEEEVPFGINTYCVTAKYGNNESDSQCVNLEYMGPCTPPQNLTATDNGDGTVTLAWEAPDIPVEGYKIYRNGSVIKSLNSNTLTYTDNTTYNGTLNYCVAASYELCTSELVCSEMEMNSSTNCAYTVVMHKNSAPTGIHGWEGASILFMNDNNDMLLSCALDDDVDEGELTSGFPHENVKCYWMNGNDDYWISFEIKDYNGTVIFEGWPYSFENSLFFEFTPDCSMDQPASCENFTATGAVDVLESYLTWTNPSTSVSGEPITLSSVVIMRDGETIHTIDNPTAGAAMTWTDVTPHAGEFNYTVYAVNEVGTSPHAHDVDTVGTYNVVPFSGTDNVTSYYGFIRCELDNIGLYPTGYDGKLTIRPGNENEFVHLEGIHYIYDGSFGGDPDHLYIYDGEDTNGVLLADCTGSCFDDKSGNRGTLDATSMSGALTLHFITGQAGGCRGITIYSSCSPATLVDECNSDETFEVYPNPAHDVLYIEGEDIGMVEIYNAYGQRVFIDENVNKINVSGFSSGIYMVKVNGTTKKIVIK